VDWGEVLKAGPRCVAPSEPKSLRWRKGQRPARRVFRLWKSATPRGARPGLGADMFLDRGTKIPGRKKILINDVADAGRIVERWETHILVWTIANHELMTIPKVSASWKPPEGMSILLVVTEAVKRRCGIAARRFRVVAGGAARSKADG